MTRGYGRCKVWGMTTTTNPETEEVAMSSFSVTCPCGCDEVVAAHDAGFTATSVEVDACPSCSANGIVSREMRKSWAYANAVPASTGLQHRDGLVVFA